MTCEAVVRHALRHHLLGHRTQAIETVDELWVPRSHERADVALIGREMTAFEIKTERDTLRRLPRQAAAYARVFDRCTAVVAAKHRSGAMEILSDWWGVVEVSVNGSVTFSEARRARPNPGVDPETLVRLLWREEVVAALVELGAPPPPRSTRAAMWNELLRLSNLTQLRTIVRKVLVERNVRGARVGSRFTPPASAGADQ